MRAIIQSYSRQAFNYWKTLGIRIKIELIILVIIFYLVFTEKLVLLLSGLLSKPGITELGLASFCGHLVLLAISVSVPFIYFKLLPVQAGIRTLRVLPLSSSNALAVLIVYIFKYQLIALLITGPLISALMTVTGFLPVLYFVYLLLVFPVIMMLLLQSLTVHASSRPVVTGMYFIILILYFSAFGYLYLGFGIIHFIADLLIFPLALFFLMRKLSPFHDTWDVMLSRRRINDLPLQKVHYQVTYRDIPTWLPGHLQAFFRREILGHLRNRSYVRMKIFSLALFITGLLLLMEYFPENRPEAAAVFGLLFVWIHYAHQFNEKYVYAESRNFIGSVPVRYRQIWLSRFLTELLFLIPVLAFTAAGMAGFGSSLMAILLVMAVVTGFSVFVLSLITSIRLLFYDNPRLAGYAYHFLIIFSVVMIGNFYLVGPVVIFFVLLYIIFLSYKQFAR